MNQQNNRLVRHYQSYRRNTIVLIILVTILPMTSCARKKIPDNLDKSSNTAATAQIPVPVYTKKQQFDFPNHSSEGGLITVKYCDKQIVEIDVQLCAERGQSEITFIRNSDATVSVEMVSSQYDKDVFDEPIGVVKVVKTTVERYQLVSGDEYQLQNSERKLMEDRKLVQLYIVDPDKWTGHKRCILFSKGDEDERKEARPVE